MNEDADFGQPVRIAAVIGIVFGVASLLSGGSVLFGPDVARTAAGQVVPFIVWFNVIAGGFYVAAGVGLRRGQRWAACLALAIAAATALAFAALGIHIWHGGGYEMRTVWAMAFRLVVWAVIAGMTARYCLGRRRAVR